MSSSSSAACSHVRPSSPSATIRYSPGKWRAINSAVAGRLAVRASSRPKKLSTKRRATSVESNRSVGA